VIKMVGSCGICGYDCGYEVDENDSPIYEKMLKYFLFVVLLFIIGFVYIENNKPSQELNTDNIPDTKTREPTAIDIRDEPPTTIYVRHINDTSGAVEDNDKINELNKIINSRVKCYIFDDSYFIRCTDGFNGVFIADENVTWVNSTYNVTNQTIIYKCYDKREGYLIYNKTEVKTCLPQSDHYIFTNYNSCNVLFFMNYFDDTKIINDRYYELKCIFDSVKYSENTTLKSIKIMDIQNHTFEIGIDE